MELKENERIDDLQCHGRMLIQNKSMFCFGIDAVLLANYAVVNEGDVCMDLCTGNGIIPVDRKSTRLNSSHASKSRMPSSA